MSLLKTIYTYMSIQCYLSATCWSSTTPVHRSYMCFLKHCIQAHFLLLFWVQTFVLSSPFPPLWLLNVGDRKKGLGLRHKTWHLPLMFYIIQKMFCFHKNMLTHFTLWKKKVIILYNTLSDSLSKALTHPIQSYAWSFSVCVKSYCFRMGLIVH